MSDDKRPARRYEVTWQSGHIETIEACQVAWPNATMGSPFALTAEKPRPSIVTFHRYVGENWTLVLRAHEDDIRTIRDVTDSERIEPPA